MKLDQAFGIHEQALKLRAYRSEVLASNLANADTPGYKARDMDFAQILRGEQHKAPQLAATNARHISSGGPAIAQDVPLGYRIPLQPSTDGNTVDAEQEQMAFSRNAMEYQASLSFIDGRIKGLLSAIRGD
jgi:flagellar basal-body rod protein FlgB